MKKRISKVQRARPRRRRPRSVAVPPPAVEDEEPTAIDEGPVAERRAHTETSPELSGGDLDADWRRAESAGDEAVGGSVATPDQDVVDEIGRALGVEQASESEVRTSEEILRTRDRHRWHLERRADFKEDEP